MGSIIQLFRAQTSAQERFTQLLRPHIELMYRMAYRWTHSREDAEDLVQDVLIKLAYRVDEMLQVEQLRPWLIKVLYHRFVDSYRRECASPVVETDDRDDIDADPLQQAAADGPTAEQRLDLQQTLAEAVAALDDDQRDVISLYAEGYTVLEIADVLDVNVGTVKSRLARARSKLKKII